MSKVTAAKDSAPAPGTDRLKVTEVFCSLQGEARSSGAPTAFIRLTGCPLRCVYCDTEYAFHGGQWRSIPGQFLMQHQGGCIHDKQLIVTAPVADKRLRSRDPE